MSQQARPLGEQSIEARPGQPRITLMQIPLKERVTLYFRNLQVTSDQVQLLVRLKTGDGNCNNAEQERIREQAQKLFRTLKPPIEWNHDNIGAYIATGLTQPTDFERAFGLSGVEIKALRDAGMDFLPVVRAKLMNNNIFNAANERLKETRIKFPEQVAIENQAREREQAMQAPLQLTQAGKDAHAYLVGAAAIDILEKKK